MSDGGKPVDFITTTHNYIDYDFKALMGKPNMMIRKGSIRAYEGERVIIPFNMRDGISICEGKSNPDWNFTAPHGAGRIMSRSKAFESLDVEEFKKEMAEAGIYTTTADEKTLDEAPGAYKPMDEIVELIEPTVDIKFFMKPKMNIKAQEDKVKFF
jgi:RNA-splicing ligase RtcB